MPVYRCRVPTQYEILLEVEADTVGEAIELIRKGKARFIDSLHKDYLFDQISLSCFEEDTVGEVLSEFSDTADRAIASGFIDLTVQQAKYIKGLKVDRKKSYKDIAGECANLWEKSWSCTGGVGELLCRMAAKLLDEDISNWS